MYKVVQFTCLIGLVASLHASIISPRASGPAVTIQSGTFKGNSSGVIDAFYGIPYAAPPLGPLRFKPPTPLTRNFPDFDATRQPPACTQHGNPAGKLTKMLPIKVPEVTGQEDCLTLDIIRPSGVKKGDKLPVFFWIFAGGFTFGFSTQNKGDNLVKKSVEMKKPMIFVAINHRLNMFGFLGGKEIAAEGSGNLGLLDQRMALEWVQANIAEFGGDPTQVTIGGASSGGMSVVYQMMANGGNHKNLFRGVISESGSPISAGRLADGSGQSVYDTIVKDSGCAGTPNTLECLRSADYTKLTTAMAKMPESVPGYPFILTFFPRIDDKFLTSSMEDALSSGKVAKVSIISGAEDDEGTGFGILLGTKLNLPDDLSNKLKHLMPAMTAPQLDKLLTLYHSDDVTQGSPFNTGYFNVLSPFYKQFSAIMGDVVFQAPRRLLTRSTQAVMPSYGYIDRGSKSLPYLGSAHASELTAVFGQMPGPRTNDFQSRWISFVNALDPNSAGLPRWERYGSGGGQVLEFKDLGSSGTIPDDFRADGTNFVIENMKALRIIAP
ncbi:putative carotenoid ester lipase precursor [Melampsora larici-populina 98AG31]|uniref:Carboxylic ester hydrolase n=1 Tax=Melampsora larici-populina (strain 98AG31 / pathotype 3-4-7) TaxID=747676 RepID=F4RL20_MELLP|nr:putative carotenoid ester lipase precursor [Melampsora larici-populina 98AG31]EGG06827.1 putative carotenoid ester lipase precursor [Melampsora larici-populina 98AG31]